MKYKYLIEVCPTYYYPEADNESLCLIKSNLPPSEIHEAYQAGIAIVGFDVEGHIKDVNTELSSSVLWLFEEAGIDSLLTDEDRDSDGEPAKDVELERDPYWYFHFWSETAMLGNPEWKWEVVKKNTYRLSI
jgi:hypothetical protein